MSGDRVTYRAGITRADGVRISMLIEAPADYPDAGDLGEVAQMGVSRTDSILTANDDRRRQLPF
jgi:hypothetical protein